ncbi:hypothetical protein N3K66_003136 [Trichothecium roseum]|uniref:Uncharacterized protein n=1 Tax=Trichothecium roseum TaxID=47278 RepID=A0ACC0V643_9HYPO|nr:hypothetical protein N3K66_003136 [Trichothecium roseum]
MWKSPLRCKMPGPTHFLCLPLRSAELSSRLAAFKVDVTRAGDDDDGVAAIPEAAVRPPGTLHLTLGVMALQDESLVQRARDVLQSLRPGDLLRRIRLAEKKTAGEEGQASPPPPPPPQLGEDGKLSLAFRGLQAMRRPDQTSVLYVPPVDDEGQTLRRLCEELRSPFREAGLMTVDDDGRPLLLHATVVNTVYVRGKGKNKGKGKGKGGRGRLTFDGREVLARYEGFAWAESVEVGEVAICRMGAKKVGDEGDQAYEVEAEVAF